MEPIYIRTDKNGTKYYHDWTCPRCGGAGFADKWIRTGRTCYECGGSGKRHAAKVVKEYTPEYWQKLNARRIAKQRKYEEEHAEEIAEAARKHTIFLFSENGCDENGIGYVITGKTYPIKEKIKKAGGKWTYGQWVCPKPIEEKGIRSYRIDISKCWDKGAEDGVGDIIWYAIKAIRKEEEENEDIEAEGHRGNAFHIRSDGKGTDAGDARLREHRDEQERNPARPGKRIPGLAE